jgi:hypothetical protein
MDDLSSILFLPAAQPASERQHKEAVTKDEVISHLRLLLANLYYPTTECERCGWVQHEADGECARCVSVE